ncbi:MAG TPA: hypothetical protein VJ747_03890, partial [Stellaceae bacterium]|nr:hypothetical protein [Stellaceae bacterium]
MAREVALDVEGGTAQEGEFEKFPLSARNRLFLRVGEDVFDALRRQCREDGAGQGTRGAADLEDAQGAIGGRRIAKMAHDRGDDLIADARCRIEIEELLRGAEIPLGKKQLAGIRFAAQQRREMFAPPRDDVEARQAIGMFSEQISPQGFWRFGGWPLHHRPDIAAARDKAVSLRERQERFEKAKAIGQHAPTLGERGEAARLFANAQTAQGTLRIGRRQAVEGRRDMTLKSVDCRMPAERRNLPAQIGGELERSRQVAAAADPKEARLKPRLPMPGGNFLGACGTDPAKAHALELGDGRSRRVEQREARNDGLSAGLEHLAMAPGDGLIAAKEANPL